MTLNILNTFDGFIMIAISSLLGTIQCCQFDLFFIHNKRRNGFKKYYKILRSLIQPINHVNELYNTLLSHKNKIYSEVGT